MTRRDLQYPLVRIFGLGQQQKKFAERSESPCHRWDLGNHRTDRALTQHVHPMGASCSIPNVSVFIIPEELVVKILSILTVPDLISCRCVNRYLNGIVDRSKQLQHHIDTAIAGVADNPNSPLSLLERREALTRRQEAWDTFQPQRTTTSKVRGWELEFPLEGKWLHLDPLREEGHHKIVQIATCPDNDDLSAIGIRCGDVQPPYSFYSFEVDILSCSGGGGERLWTRKSTVRVKDVLKEDVLWEMQIEIHTDLLAALLTPKVTSRGWPDRELSVFYWKTGERIAYLKARGIKAFRFLSSSFMVVAIVNPSESTATLELFGLPVTKGNARPTSMTKVTALGLPSVDNGCRIARVDFYPLFVKNLAIRGNHLLYNASTDAKPFVSTKPDIMYIYLNIGSGYGYDNISFVVHPSTLLRYALPSQSHGNLQHPVPWMSWGPTTTRWYEGGILVGGGPITCGDRCLLRSMGYPVAWELWDFNPYRVRRLEKGLAVENETARLTLETEPSCAKSHGIKEGIYSSLPFVKVAPKNWPAYTYTGLYEDRVIGEMHSAAEGCRLIENLYFG